MMLYAGFFGEVTAPAALAPYGANGGLITFLTNMVTLLVIVGGAWALFNIVLAGLQYISAQGDPKQMTKVVQTLTGSLLGIVVMIGAPIIMAIIGFLLFKDSTFFLSPQLVGPTP